MPFPKVSAVVLNYHTPLDTREAVASLKRMDYPDLHIIVVDNASDDALRERLRQEHSDVQFIQNEENLGFSGGCNIGILEAVKRGAEYILLFNSDATAARDLLRELVAVAEEDPGIGVLGPTILEDQGEVVWYQGGAINRFLGYTRHPGMGKPPSVDSAQSVPTDYVTGCVMLVRREVVEEVGPLEEDYFVYVEDVEFSERARKVGYKVLHYQKALASHKVSASAGERGTNVMTPLRAYYFARNMVHFIRKHITGWKRWTALQGQVFVRAPYRLLSMPVDGQLRSVGPYVQGLWHGLMGLTGKWEQHDRWTS